MISIHSFSSSIIFLNPHESALRHVFFNDSAHFLFTSCLIHRLTPFPIRIIPYNGITVKHSFRIRNVNQIKSLTNIENGFNMYPIPYIKENVYVFWGSCFVLSLPSLFVISFRLLFRSTDCKKNESY